MSILNPKSFYKEGKFQRSSYMTQYHSVVRERQAFVENVTGEKISYNELKQKKNNVLEKNIVVYEVSFQMTYASKKKGNGLNIETQTFKVYALRSPETSNAVMDNTLSMYRNMSFDGGNQFNSGLKDKIEDANNLDDLTPRGLEERDLDELSPQLIRELGNSEQKMVVVGLQQEVKVSKTKDSPKSTGSVSDLYFKKS